MPERGVIEDRERARQIRDFRELLYGTITPTDIDGLIEYHGKAYVFIETKLKGTPIKDGQRLALERMADDLTRAKRPTLCIIAEHDVQDPLKDINVAETQVKEYRWRGEWKNNREVTTKDLIDMFLNAIDHPNRQLKETQ